MNRIQSIWQERIVVPIKHLLLIGVTPHRIALSIATGTIVGIFPIIGTTTALCVLLALSLRLNMVAMQAFNWLVAGMQWILLLPFIRFGEFLFQAQPLPLSRTELEAMFSDGFVYALQTLGWSLIHGVSGWAVIAPFLFAVTYFAALPFLQRARWAQRVTA